jgi:hypothetical protein
MEKQITGVPLHARINSEMVKTPPIQADEGNLVAGRRGLPRPVRGLPWGSRQAVAVCGAHVSRCAASLGKAPQRQCGGGERRPAGGDLLADPPTGPRLLPLPRPDRPGLRGRRRAPPPAPRGRGHLHHRSQHQLHQLLHRVLHLLRLLPAAPKGPARRKRATSSISRRSTRRSPRRRWAAPAC